MTALVLFASSCDARRPTSTDERQERLAGEGGPVAGLWRSVEYAALAAHVQRECEPRRGHRAYDEAIEARHLSAVPDELAYFIELLDRQDALRDVLHAYTGCGLLAEAFDVGVLNLELAARMVPLAEAFLAGTAPDDPRLPTRREGHRQALEGIAQSVLGSVVIVIDPGGDPEVFTPMAERYLAAVDSLKAAGPPGFLDGSRDLLRGLEDAPRHPARQALIDRLLRVLEPGSSR
jgi:hypothetical protein